MNTYALVMQSSGLTPLAQWLVIGLSMTALVVAVIASGAEQIPAWKVRVMGGIAVALVMAVLAATASAAIIVPCSDWGCWFDTIFW